MFMNSDLSPLQRERLDYHPKLPSILENPALLYPLFEKTSFPVEEDIKNLFPNTSSQQQICFKRGEPKKHRPLKIGVVFSGGQAPGGNNVISGLLDALHRLNPNSKLFGFLNGPSGIINNQVIQLTDVTIAPYRNQGGFDLIGSGRTKIEKPEQFESAEKTVRALGLDGLVIIGGDDSNTNAAFLAEYFKQKGLSISVVGVPKTIDGDLKNEYIEISFGYDTACKVYAEIIGNLAKDSLSAKKYYFFVKLMGRSASHITLECALKTQINLALIGEEVAAKKQTLHDLVDQIADMICLRAEKGKNYGVILIPEGIIEFIVDFKVMIKELNALLNHDHYQDKTQDYRMEQCESIIRALSPESAACFNHLPESIQKQLLLDRDPHGNVQVSKIETERLFIDLVEKELQKRAQEGLYKGKFSPQPLFCGYEGRSGLPSNFDCRYCYALGFAAALLVNAEASGYMACIRNLSLPVDNWKIEGIPLVKMLHLERRNGKDAVVIQKGLVDLNGEIFASYRAKRGDWLLEDHYSCPGPIQFEGPSELTDKGPLSLSLNQKNDSRYLLT